MRRRGAGLAVLLVLQLVGAGAAAAAPDPSFHVFEHRVCRLVRRQNRAVAPYILGFNHYYYDSERTPENLRAASPYYRRMYSAWTAYARRFRSVPAPVSQRALWRQEGRDERQVLRIGRKQVGALAEANDPLFQSYERKNEAWQRRRNATWNRIGLFCS